MTGPVGRHRAVPRRLPADPVVGLVGLAADDLPGPPTRTPNTLDSARNRLLAVLALVVVTSLGPDVLAFIHVPGTDVVGHTVAYATMTLALLGTYDERDPEDLVLLEVAAITLGVGAAMELSQMLVHRDAQWSDLAADTLGVAAVFAYLESERLAHGLRRWSELPLLRLLRDPAPRVPA